MLKSYAVILLFPISFFFSSCSQNKDANSTNTADRSLVKEGGVDASNSAQEVSPEASKARKPANAATILSRKQVPILCYHQVRDWRETDSKTAKDYIIPISAFKAQVKMLADSGYHSVLPDQVYNYLVYGDPLPSKPIMFTFDDTDLDQFTIAAPELKKYGYKAVYFIMTVSIGKMGKTKYMSSDQIRQLSDAGNVIGSHTYDHKNVKKYEGEDWITQLDKPTKRLEEIIGKKIDYFAYPFGLWNKAAIPELKKRGFKAAFALAESRDDNDPLFTIRRIIASGYWSPKTLHNSIVNSFSGKRN